MRNGAIFENFPSGAWLINFEYLRTITEKGIKPGGQRINNKTVEMFLNRLEKRLQAIKLQLAVGHILCCLLIFTSRYFNPITTNDVAINHETKCKKNIAFVCHEALHTKAINLYASIKNACKLSVINKLPDIKRIMQVSRCSIMFIIKSSHEEKSK